MVLAVDFLDYNTVIDYNIITAIVTVSWPGIMHMYTLYPILPQQANKNTSSKQLISKKAATNLCW